MTAPGGALDRVPSAPFASSWEHLTDELRWLDLLLERAIVRGHATRSADPFEQLRGLVVTKEEVTALLAGDGAEGREPAPEMRAIEERLAASESAIAVRMAMGGDLALPRLAHRFQLTAFEHQALLLCLAPEVDRKYDKLYAYLQDDVTRKRPTAGLALDLFCASPEERLAGRAAFTEGAPLVRHRLVRLSETGHDGPQPLLGRALRPPISWGMPGSIRASRAAHASPIPAPCRSPGPPPRSKDGCARWPEASRRDRSRAAGTCSFTCEAPMAAAGEPWPPPRRPNWGGHCSPPRSRAFRTQGCRRRRPSSCSSVRPSCSRRCSPSPVSTCCWPTMPSAGACSP